MKYYTAKELANELGVTVQTIRNWGEKGGIGVFQPLGKGFTKRYFIKECTDVRVAEGSIQSQATISE